MRRQPLNHSRQKTQETTWEKPTASRVSSELQGTLSTFTSDTAVDSQKKSTRQEASILKNEDKAICSNMDHTE